MSHQIREISRNYQSALIRSLYLNHIFEMKNYDYFSYDTKKHMIKKHEATFRWKRTKIVRWKRWTIYSMIGIYLLFMLAGSLGSCLAHVWLAVRYSVWLDSCFCAKPVLVQIFLTSITLNSVRGLVRSFKTIKTKLISQCWLLACYMKIYSVFNPQYFPRSSLQETDKKSSNLKEYWIAIFPKYGEKINYEMMKQ